MTRRQDGTYGVAAVPGLRCASRWDANRVRRVLRAWTGPRDGDTIVRLADWALRCRGAWTKSILASFAHEQGGSE